MDIKGLVDPEALRAAWSHGNDNVVTLRLLPPEGRSSPEWIDFDLYGRESVSAGVATCSDSPHPPPPTHFLLTGAE